MKISITIFTKLFVFMAILSQLSSVFAAMKTDPNVQLISAAKKGDLGG